MKREKNLNQIKLKKKNASQSFKHTVFYLPQFLDPINMIRIKYDLTLNWNKTYNSDIENMMSYKNVSKVNFNMKYNILETLEIEFKNLNKYSTPKELILERLQSLNDEYAMQFGEIAFKYLSNWKKPITLDYKNTIEYQQYLKKVKKHISNHYGEANFVLHSKYDDDFQGIEICKAIFSKKFLDIIYEGNINELQEDFLNNKDRIPFLGYAYNGNRFQYLVEGLNSTYDPTQKTPVYVVDLTKDGFNIKKAQHYFKILNFYDPNDPGRILETHSVNIFKCLDPKILDKNKNIKNKTMENTFTKKIGNEKANCLEIEKKNSDFLEKYYN